MSSRKVKTSPWRWQPKQYQVCVCGWTVKLGVSSWWKGHRPTKSLLRLVSRRCSWTTLTRSTLALTSAKASSVDGWGIPLIVRRSELRDSRGYEGLKAAGVAKRILGAIVSQGFVEGPVRVGPVMGLPSERPSPQPSPLNGGREGSVVGF